MQKWNLQDIRPTEPRRRNNPVDVQKNTLHTNIERPTRTVREADDATERLVIKDGNKESKKGIFLMVALIVLVIGGVFGLSALLAKTTLTIHPENRVVTVNAEFTAYPERRDGLLSYAIITVAEEGEAQVAATGQETVTAQAKGFIEIIKTTPGSERLIKNTRFRGPGGLIFRIQESVVVPGALRDSSGTLVPGTIRAEVFADAVGPDYNLPAGSRFDIPGFEENNLTDLFKSIYAENREAFTGGFNGPRFIIDDAELDTTKQRIHVELRDKLLARVDSEKPVGTIAFPGSIAFTYESLPSVRYGDNLVTVRERAIMQVPVFAAADFSSFIAKETIASYNRQQPVTITNLDDLTFSYTDPGMSAKNLANETSLTFNLTGKPSILWLYEAEKLKTDLAGKSFTALSLALSAHPGIKSAKITGKPFWQRSFPEDPNELQIIEVIDQTEQ